MEIYLLRHGIAEDGAVGMPDAERALTNEGTQKVRQVLKCAQKAGVKPALIFSSPYRRALETAEVAAKVFGPPQQVLQTRALTPGGSPEEVWEEVRVHRGEEQILLVSHEPLISQLASYLLGVPSLMVEMKKGALARITIAQFGAHPRGMLRWLITARLANAND
jgi:phosphohistidine phosphatase